MGGARLRVFALLSRSSLPSVRAKLVRGDGSCVVVAVHAHVGLAPLACEHSTCGARLAAVGVQRHAVVHVELGGARVALPARHVALHEAVRLDASEPRVPDEPGRDRRGCDLALTHSVATHIGGRQGVDTRGQVLTQRLLPATMPPPPVLACTPHAARGYASTHGRPAPSSPRACEADGSPAHVPVRATHEQKLRHCERPAARGPVRG